MRFQYKPFRFSAQKFGPTASLLLIIGTLSFLLLSLYIFLWLMGAIFARSFFLGLFFLFFLAPAIGRFFFFILVSFLVALWTRFSSFSQAGRHSSGQDDDDVIDVNYKILNEDENN